MPYKCRCGCTSYNPLCDACDSETEDTSVYERDTDIKFKAAKRGMTKQEYLDSEET